MQSYQSPVTDINHQWVISAINQSVRLTQLWCSMLSHRLLKNKYTTQQLHHNSEEIIWEQRDYKRTKRLYENKEIIWEQRDYMRTKRLYENKEIRWEQRDYMRTKGLDENKEIIWEQRDYMRTKRLDENKEIIWEQRDYMRTKRLYENKEIIWEQRDYMRTKRLYENKETKVWQDKRPLVTALFSVSHLSFSAWALSSELTCSASFCIRLECRW